MKLQTMPTFVEDIKVHQRMNRQDNKQENQHSERFHKYNTIKLILHFNLNTHFFEFSAKGWIHFRDFYTQMRDFRKTFLHRNADPRSDMFQQFRGNRHFIFHYGIYCLIINRGGEHVSSFSFRGVGVGNHIHKKTIANDLLFGKTTVI